MKNTLINLCRYKFLFLLSLFFLLPDIADAQYFGRNKVHYDNFSFKIMKTPHFRIYYYPIEKEAVTGAAYMLERWDDRLSKVFGNILGNEQPIILYANHADFQQTNVISGLIPQGTGGVTEGLKNRVIIPFTGINKDNDHVLGHELVHTFQYTMLKSRKGGISAGMKMPLWLIEGMAEYLSIGRVDPLTTMWLRDAVLNDDVPSIDDISTSSKYFPYRYGEAIWAYIAGNYGDKSVRMLLDSTQALGFEDGFKSLFGYGVDSLSKAWEADVKSAYKKQIVGKTKPDSLGKTVIADEDIMNLSPVISPDGKYIAFLSSRDLFSLDLYLADAATGKIIKKLVSSETDRHFDALRFINSSGTWSPDGKQFAFVVIEEGNNAIDIVDVSSGNIQKEIQIGDADEISFLSWSPNGTSITFSGSKGGISNIYLYHIDTEKSERLTNDMYSEVQPVWSPDGKTIAFITDRGERTNLDEYRFGSINIGLMNVNTKRITSLSMNEGTKHLNPQFSPDGKNLYFISDPDGFNNIYKYSFEADSFSQITNAATGISGLTDMSPAISIAGSSNIMTYSVFNKATYEIHTQNLNTTEGKFTELSDSAAKYNAAMPPQKKFGKGIVSNYLDNPKAGLPEDLKMDITDYHPSLKMVYIGQAVVGVAVNQYGSGIGGGISMLFSDMLSNHILSVVVQANGDFKDIGGEAQYVNRETRFNYGAAIGHIPYQTVSVSSYIDTASVGGSPTYVQNLQLLRQRVFVDQVSLLGAYPFSTNRRAEISLGYTRISYDLERETYVSTLNGFLLSNNTKSLPSPSALNLFQLGAAYVGDYSYFGFTSPIKGSRFRFEVEPTVGSLQFLTALADYRKYFFLNPITIALRGLHYGRYFGDADNNRLSPLYVGYDTWVRGYSINSFDLTECSQTNDPYGCPEIDRLIGSRIGIINAEIRLPLFGTEQFGLINFPYLPTEIVGFLDGGIAWSKSNPPIFKLSKNSNQRIPVFSAGLAARVNLFGYLVGQVYYAYPFQRPGKGFVFGFVISPGW